MKTQNTTMKLVYTIIFAFSLGLLSAQAAEPRDPLPKFIKVGKTYQTAIGMMRMTFQVIESDGSWIRVKAIKGISKKEITGEIWLNVRELPIIIEGSKDSKNEGDDTDGEKIDRK